MSSEESETRRRILNATWKLLEDRQGQGVRMSDIAKGAGISRQAVYLHFESRTDLLIATTKYVDEVKGLDERLKRFETATTGEGRLDALVEIWGNYIPEIYGIAKALLTTRETDEAAAAAWDDSMDCLRQACRAVIESLRGDGTLAGDWSTKEATDLFMTLLSIANWEYLTQDCGWSTKRYVRATQRMLKYSFTNI